MNGIGSKKNKMGWYVNFAHYSHIDRGYILDEGQGTKPYQNRGDRLYVGRVG